MLLHGSSRPSACPSNTQPSKRRKKAEEKKKRRRGQEQPPRPEAAPGTGRPSSLMCHARLERLGCVPVVCVKGGAWVSKRQKKASLVWPGSLLSFEAPFHLLYCTDGHTQPCPASPRRAGSSQGTRDNIIGLLCTCQKHGKGGGTSGQQPRPFVFFCLSRASATLWIPCNEQRSKGPWDTLISRTSNRFSMSTTTRPGYWTCWQQGRVSTRACHTRPVPAPFDLLTLLA